MDDEHVKSRMKEVANELGNPISHLSVEVK